MKRHVHMLVSLFAIIGYTCVMARERADIKKVEDRTRYASETAEGRRFEVVVIRWNLDFEMNPAALLYYASLEVAEQRGIRIFGKYRVEHSTDEKRLYLASVFGSDGETGRFASATISGLGSEVVTIRVISWGIREDEHRIRAAELIARFTSDKPPNKAPEPTTTAVTPRAP